MVLDAFTINKHDDRTNTIAWLREIPFISYGFISEIRDDVTVHVKPVIQANPATPQEVTVTLVSLSSALFELKVKPKLGDLVLLLSLQNYDARMFQRPDFREEGEEVIQRAGQNGYTYSSMIGILMKTVTMTSQIRASVYEDEDSAVMSVDGDTDLIALLRRKVCLGLVSPDDEEYPVTVLVDPQHPVDVRINAARVIETGITDVADEKRREEEAPIIEKIHGKSPITRIVRSALSLVWGIGNEESESEDEDRDANIDVKMGAKSEVTLESKSGLTAKFKKALSLEGEDTLTAKLKKAIDITGDDTFTAKLKKAINITGEDSMTAKFKKAVAVSCDDTLKLEFKKDVVLDAGAGKATIKNSGGSMCSLLLELIDKIEQLKTFGSPPAHAVDPSSIAALEAFKQKVQLLWKD